MLKPMWDAKAVKAYESGQGVKLVSTPHPHYEPLPDDLNPESLETTEIDLPPREWVELTLAEVVVAYNQHAKYQEEDMGASGWVDFAIAIEAKLRSKNHD